MKKIKAAVLVIFFAALSYLAGYYTVQKSKPETEPEAVIQRTAKETAGVTAKAEEAEATETYYIARLQGEWLLVMTLPDGQMFEYVRAEEIQITSETGKLLETGIRFETQQEVYEFLENCMS